MLGFPTFLSPPQSSAIQEGTFSHAQKEEKPGPQSFIHNSEFQKALKTKLFFLSLPLTPSVTKSDLNGWEKMDVLMQTGCLGSCGVWFRLQPHPRLESRSNT